MMPTEYIIHEHRKEMERTAAQINLARMARPQGEVSRIRRFVRMIMAVRLNRRRSSPQPVPCPQPLRRLA